MRPNSNVNVPSRGVSLLARRSISTERECKRSRYIIVAYPICRSVCLSVPKVYCGKTADWIRMPFGVVSGVGLGMGVLDFGGCLLYTSDAADE